MVDSWWHWFQEQFWLYWVFDPAWWLQASQGAIGALIGFVGLYIAYKLTQRWEEKRHADQRMMEGVAGVIQATLEVVEASPKNRTQATKLAAKLIVFGTQEVSTHPRTGEWSAIHGSNFLTWATKDNSEILLKERAAIVGTELMQWVKDGRKDKQLKPYEAHEDWRLAINAAGLQNSSENIDRDPGRIPPWASVSEAHKGRESAR